jgi:[NiFe] hydrogenase diaphorase moiety large subunit
MDQDLRKAVKKICGDCGKDRTRLMDIACRVQDQFGCVSSEAIDLIARELSMPRVEVESLVTFYAFFSKRPKGKIVIRLCNDVIDEMAGVDRVAKVFSEELGIGFGETTPDGKITLEWTPCIGMSDQAPAALVNEVVVRRLSTDSAREIVKELQCHGDPAKLVKMMGDGNNGHPLVRAGVFNYIRKRGPVIFGDMTPGEAIKRAIAMTPAEIIRDMKTARLRGRGGAGFPTGMKWEFTRQAPGAKRYVLCNADEGEPGTFKDRVILTECPDLLFEGMTIAGFAIGSDSGILYLRGEYAYLHRFLEHVLAERRSKGLLGTSIRGNKGFDFDIRIQMGAGAYICGEETALISSCEGMRGDPKTRPPFPAQKGYLGQPTTVNNVETFCCAARILEKGAAWFLEMGSKGSPGTKLLSVSGDCSSPGVYEVPFGIALAELLTMVGAEDTQAVQLGGPSGQMVGPNDFTRTICYDDLATGGSVMVFNNQRSLLRVVRKFMDFFVEESCGFCTPCRVGNVLLRERIGQILAGRGEPADLAYLKDLGETVKAASQCGLGQTSANPVLSTLKNFRHVYEKAVKEPTGEFQPSFDIQAALLDAQKITGRRSVHF